MRIFLLAFVASISLVSTAQAGNGVQASKVLQQEAHRVSGVVVTPPPSDDDRCRSLGEAVAVEKELLRAAILRRAISLPLPGSSSYARYGGLADLGSLVKAGADLERAHERLREEFCHDTDENAAPVP